MIAGIKGVQSAVATIASLSGVSAKLPYFAPSSPQILPKRNVNLLTLHLSLLAPPSVITGLINYVGPRDVDHFSGSARRSNQKTA